MRAFIACVAALTTLSTPVLAEPVSSITQYGITWTFESPVESGTYASGDHWVVGPATITSISPSPTGVRNGACVNPQPGRQCYDDRGGEFSNEDAITLPYTLAPGESLVSSVSKPEGSPTQNAGALTSQAVLTAVMAPPPPNAFRPSYAGTYKAELSADAIDWSLLPKLPPPASAPNGAGLLAMAERPRIDHIGNWTIQHSCAEENWNNGPGAHACYGREYSTFVSQAAQYLMLDTPERDELAISIVQLGIDNYGVLRAGGGWPADGGHHSGRKFPIVLAAVLLNDCDMLEVGEEYDSSHFGEDGQTYFGADGTPLWGKACGNASYFESGCSGGGAKDCRDPAGLVDGCEDYRNCCTSAYWVGQMLAAKMLHAEAVWNHDAYFEYVDRWMSGGVDGGGSAATAFIEDMWQVHRNDLPPGSEVSTTCLPSGSGGAGGVGGSGGAAGAAGGAGATASGGSPGSAGQAAGGAAAKPTSDDDDGGCGCRVAPAKSSLATLAPLLALLCASRLRRRRSSSP